MLSKDEIGEMREDRDLLIFRLLDERELLVGEHEAVKPILARSESNELFHAWQAVEDFK